MGRGMRAGKKKSGGAGKQMQQMQQMQQIQMMQEKMQEAQKEIEEKEFTTTAGGGVVEVTVNGKKQIVNLKLKPEVVDPDDIEMLQDLIISATNEAMRQVEEHSNEQMERLTGGLSIPGMI